MSELQSIPVVITRKTKLKHLLELDTLSGEEIVDWFVQHARPEDVPEKEYADMLLNLDVIEELPAFTQAFKDSMNSRVTVGKKSRWRS